MAVTRRTFAKAIGASIPFASICAVARENPIPEQNPGEFVLQRPSPLDPKRKVSVIGFGGVRLPVTTGRLGNQTDPVDYATATKYVDYALAHGINWFDSGYHYQGGDSERFFGHALSRHPRESFWFCTKAPPWDISSLADAKRIFKEQLERTKLGYFDVYMLHSLVHQEDYEKTFVKTGAIDYFREEKAKGRIRHFGFSFHGREDFMDYLLETQKWDVVTILVNGIDWRGPNRSESLLSKLRAKGIPAVGMESLAGGRLAHLVPAARERLKKARPGLADVAWSLKFAAEREGVMTAMTGFTRFEHLKEDIAIFNAKGYKPLSPDEVAAYLEAIKINSGGGEGVPCSGCGYCMPCPYGVDIMGVFHWWNMKLKWSRLPSVADPADSKARQDFLAEHVKRFGMFRGAERCIGCERCEKKCPQWQFNIPKELAKIDSFVESVRRAELGCFTQPSSEASGAQWVNVGSNSGLFAFDWKSANVCGMNLAGSPQSERRSAAKLKSQRGEICKGAVVVIPLCLFSSVLPESYDKKNSATAHPLLSFDGKPDEKQMEGFADMLDKVWKREFSILDYADPMTEANRLSYRANVAHMREFLIWCKQEGLTPVLVLPPAAECLRRLFPDSFMQAYVYDFIREVTKGTDVKFLDYWHDEEFQDVRLYATSLFLNRTGRRLFTAKVIKRLTSK